MTFPDDEANIQYPSPCVEIDTHINERLNDDGKFDGQFPIDLTSVSKLSSLNSVGRHCKCNKSFSFAVLVLLFTTFPGYKCAHMLYSYRSVSRTIPLSTPQYPKGSSKAFVEEMESKLDEINERTIGKL